MLTNLISIPAIVNDLQFSPSAHYTPFLAGFILSSTSPCISPLLFLFYQQYIGMGIFSLSLFLSQTLSSAPFSLAINTSRLSPLSLSVKESEIVAYLCFLKFFSSLSKLRSSWVFYNYMSSETILIQVTNNFHFVIL